MQKKTLTSLFSDYLFRIPDYQRGYAWVKPHWLDFVQDVDGLVDEEVRGHYTGTVVVYRQDDADSTADVVDGQQRLTTSCLYLSLIARELVARGDRGYQRAVEAFLFAEGRCRLELNNDCKELFHDLLKHGRSNTTVLTPHGKRLVQALDFMTVHLHTQLQARGETAGDYLQALYNALTQKLHFTFYTIEEECEIGMTFELMNSRGKDLSVLELLKNYLMHWASRNGHKHGTAQALTATLNRSWKTIYGNLGTCTGNEDQCLRIAWTLYCSHSPKNWVGYKGFKESQYIPLRDFSLRNERETREFIVTFAEGLTEVSAEYARIVTPSAATTTPGELTWLTKIHHTGNIANFLPLLVSARKCRNDRSLAEDHYIELLRALEHYAYRVFLFDGRKSNTGTSRFNYLAYRMFHGKLDVAAVISEVYGMARYYSSDKGFKTWIGEPDNWYHYRYLLKYTLYEYELYLTEKEGKGHRAKIAWEDLKDSTLEHILPQTPAADSHWRDVWDAKNTELYLHDIGNLVLTHNNSNYRNFDFARKKGSAGSGYSYSNSDIRQERKLALFEDWTPLECEERRQTLVDWISTRWGSPYAVEAAPEAFAGDLDEDADE
ncbi:DUF262 domain-containing protein [Pseudomonas sp. SDI]|uniref:DUF262 domain-containing protein n=1 Tax=Pseudomonas sp. SDI TaxID=2170734 RepID=UPI0014035580|nr:DUF262 domain-containing protein [Pseudomonas sp. SDI]